MITRRLHKLVTLIHDHHLTILTSKQLIEEIQGVLSRPKFEKHIKSVDVREAITIHIKLCEIVATEETVDRLSDKKDNFLLNLYNIGKAKVIVSGDKELLHEASELNYRVMSLREFELLYRQ